MGWVDSDNAIAQEIVEGETSAIYGVFAKDNSPISDYGAVYILWRVGFNPETGIRMYRKIYDDGDFESCDEANEPVWNDLGGASDYELDHIVSDSTYEGLDIHIVCEVHSETDDIRYLKHYWFATYDNKWYSETIGVPRTYTGAVSYDPKIAVAPNGNLYLIYQDAVDIGNGYKMQTFFTKKVGGVWQNGVQISDEVEYQYGTKTPTGEEAGIYPVNIKVDPVNRAFVCYEQIEINFSPACRHYYDKSMRVVDTGMNDEWETGAEIVWSTYLAHPAIAVDDQSTKFFTVCHGSSGTSNEKPRMYRGYMGASPLWEMTWEYSSAHIESNVDFNKAKETNLTTGVGTLRISHDSTLLTQGSTYVAFSYNSEGDLSLWYLEIGEWDGGWGNHPSSDGEINDHSEDTHIHSAYRTFYSEYLAKYKLLYWNNDVDAVGGEAMLLTEFQFDIPGQACPMPVSYSIDPYCPIDIYHRYPGRATGEAANKLIDSVAAFQSWGVQAGWNVYNRSTGVSATVVSVDSQSQLTLNSDIFAEGDFYTIEEYYATLDYLLDAEWREEPYGAMGSIIVDNAGGQYDSFSAVNKWVRIRRGYYHNGSPFTFEHAQWFKIVAQNPGSSPEEPEDSYVFQFRGLMDVLAGYRNPDYLHFNVTDPGDDTAYGEYVGTKTGWEIVDHITKLAGLSLGADMVNMASEYIKTTYPAVTFEPNLNGLQMVLYIINHFKAELLPRQDKFHMLIEDNGKAYTYSNPSDNVYNSFTKGRTQEILNKILKCEVYSGDAEYSGGVITASFSGEYVSTDPPWTPDLGRLRYIDQIGIVTSDDIADAIAEAQVYKNKSQASSGEWTLPIMDVCQELYTETSMLDNRGNTSGVGLTGGIYWHFKPISRNNLIETVYTCRVRLGGLRSAPAPDIQSLVNDMAIGMGNGISGKYINEGLDGIQDGMVYKKVRATNISEDGNIQLTTTTTFEGKWYDESGVELDSDWGIDIYGEDMAFTTSGFKSTIDYIHDGGSGQITIRTNTQIDVDPTITAGDKVRIRGTENYDGKYEVQNVLDANTFKVNALYVGDETAGQVYKIQISIDSQGFLDIYGQSIVFKDGSFYGHIFNSGGNLHISASLIILEGAYGVVIPSLTADPIGYYVGQLYFNSVSGKLKVCTAVPSTWETVTST